MSWRTVVCLALSLSIPGCFADELWEGDVLRCSDNSQDSLARLMLDSPRPPSPTGWFGTANRSSEDTWNSVEIEDAEGLGPTLKFRARFRGGNFTDDWTVDLTANGFSEYEGTAERLVSVTLPFFGTNTSTVRCDIRLRRVH